MAEPITELNPELCGELAREVFQKPNRTARKTDEALDNEIQQSLLGVSYIIISEHWNMILPYELLEFAGCHPKHLFWALLFLNCCCIEPVLVREFGARVRGARVPRRVGVGSARVRVIRP